MDKNDWNRPEEEMNGKQTSCPKCALEFKTMLHPFCTHKECPVRDYDNRDNPAVVDHAMVPDGWSIEKGTKGKQDMSNNIHSCSYYCDRPACIKAQRDELREIWEREQSPAAKYQELCAAVYQAAGAFNMPERILDALSDAACGRIEDRRKTDDLLPCTPEQSPAVDFDTWQKNPYTKVLEKSIAEDYVPAVDHAAMMVKLRELQSEVDDAGFDKSNGYISDKIDAAIGDTP